MYHKSHCFDKRNDVSVYVGEHKSGIGKSLVTKFRSMVN